MEVEARRKESSEGQHAGRQVKAATWQLLGPLDVHSTGSCFEGGPASHRHTVIGRHAVGEQLAHVLPGQGGAQCLHSRLPAGLAIAAGGSCRHLWLSLAPPPAPAAVVAAAAGLLAGRPGLHPRQPRRGRCCCLCLLEVEAGGAPAAVGCGWRQCRLSAGRRVAACWHLLRQRGGRGERKSWPGS
jgi:hypothetical protein